MSEVTNLFYDYYQLSIQPHKCLGAVIWLSFFILIKW